MHCPECQHVNREGARFCAQCAASLEAAVACQRCGRVNPAGAKFCDGCGDALAAASPPEPPAGSAVTAGAPAARDLREHTPRHLAAKILDASATLAGERRQVSVLFADLVRFTALAERLDAEDVHRLVGRALDVAAAEIHRFEGTINQYTGDGFMALFGAPIAHEHGPRRAVHAALGVQRAVHELSRELEAERGFGLQMRIGINTGMVVVGEIGRDLRMEYTAIGDTVNLAQRLESAARPGAVVISKATAKLVEGFFETRELGALKLKGHEARVEAFEVECARGRPTRLHAHTERGLTPLVGRERELTVLEELYAEARAGRGQIALVAGEAGIGKSRLLHEFQARLASSGEDVVWREGHCASFGQAIPFLPLIEQVREGFGIEGSDGEPEIIAKTEDRMRRVGGLEGHIPYVRHLLSVDPGAPEIAAMDRAAIRKRTFDALRALGLRTSSTQPAVYVFEDLHWTDSSTEEYLSSVVDSVVGAPQLVILTYRVGYDPPIPRRSFQTSITLRHLSETESVSMAKGMLATEEFPEQLQAALMSKAEGVPLYVEEVTKTLLDIGVLERRDGRYHLVRDPATAAIPETIQDVIMARLDRLGEDGKRAVQLASVIGRQFLVRLLDRVADFVGDLDGLLEELKAVEIIYEHGLLPEPAYVFKHAVIQDVAYNSLLLEHRKGLHGAVARAIEDLYEDRIGEHHGELAHHWMKAEEWGRAFEMSVLAGQRAAAAYANREAKVHFENALTAAKRLAGSPEAPGYDAMIALHAGRGTVLNILAEFEESLASYNEALGLARAQGDRVREVKLLVDTAIVYENSHQCDPAVEYCSKAVELARELGDKGYEAIARATRVAVVSAGLGQILETTTDAEEALRLSREVGDPRLLAMTNARLGGTLQWRADYGRGIAALTEGVEIAERVHDGYSFGYAAFMLGHARLSTGSYEEALSTYRRLDEYAQGAADTFYMARVGNCIAAVHLETYDLDESIRLNLEADEAAHRIWPWPEPRGHSLLKVGLAYIEKDAHGQAREYFEKAFGMLELDTWFRWRWEIPLMSALGELALLEGRTDEAARCVAKSLEIAERTDSRKHAVRGRRLQGAIAVASGAAEEGVRLMSDALDEADRIGACREQWLGSAELGKVLLSMGRDDEAERRLRAAADVIETIASRLTSPGLHASFLGARPVVEIHDLLGASLPQRDRS